LAIVAVDTHSYECHAPHTAPAACWWSEASRK